MSPNPKPLLIVDDDTGLLRQLRWAFSNHKVFPAGKRQEAIEFVRREAIPVAILDLGLPPDPDGASEGLATLTEILAIAPATKVVIATGNETREYALRAIALGASGTGKELLAQALHKMSRRAAGPFVPINCAAIPETLLESELFGHEKGAFTGALRQNIGRIESADRGTLFLDEIGDVPLPMQVKLLRFLQDQIVERVGGRKPIQVDVRIVCATNQDLDRLMAEGRFREDLYYRLNEVTVRVPPLRERPGDTVVLASFFLRRFASEYGRPVRGF